MADLPAKAFVLMAALRLRFGGITLRESLRTLLWEDASPTRARDSVRGLIAEIRRWQEQHGVTLIATDGQAIRLVVPTDLDVLLEAWAPGTAAEVRTLEAACGGAFLDGVGSGLGQQLLASLTDWRTEVRQRYVALILPAASKMGGKEGERVLRGLYDSEPDNEVLLRALMQHLANERGEEAASGIYDAFLARLTAEGRRPTLETQALHAQIFPSPIAPEPKRTVDRTGGPGGVPRIVMLTPPPLAVPQRAAGLAAALIEDVTLRLCSQRTFAMLAPHTARQIEGADAVAAAAPVDVDYVAVSRLVPDRNGPVLNVALIRADNREIVVSRRFDFIEDELEARFGELAYMITSQLNAGIEDIELKSYRNTGAASAYVHFLLGVEAYDPHDLPSIRRARGSFGRALLLDQNYVPALTGKARCLSNEALVRRRRDADLLDTAMELARRAEQIDPLDPNGPREKAHASLYMNDIDAGLEYIEIAASRARHHADILAEKAELLGHASKHSEARIAAEKAIALNPLAPDDYYWTLASTEFFLGHPEIAVTTLERMKRPASASRLMAASAILAGDKHKAAFYRDRFLETFPDARIERVGEFLPHKNKADIALYKDALKKAGFP